MDEDKAWLYRVIRDHCIYRVGPGEELLPAKNAAKKYSWQFYLRRGLCNAEFMERIGGLFWERFAPLYRERPFQITGMETGATPLIVGLSMTAPFSVNCFITRAERKKYGLLNQFEGIVDDKLPVMIVDDLSSSKSTMHRCRVCLESAGLEVYDTAFAVIEKDVGAHDHGHLVPNIVTLFKASDFPLKYGAYLEREGKPPQRWKEGWTRKAPQMLHYVYDHPQIVGDFVASLIPHCRRGFGPNIMTLGIVDGSGALIAGLVYHNWDPEAAIVEISGAALPGKYWLTRKTLTRMYDYPFNHLNVQMIVQRTPADDTKLLGMLAAYDYSLIPVPRMFGRDRDGVVCCLTREAWESNRFNRKPERLSDALSHAA